MTKANSEHAAKTMRDRDRDAQAKHRDNRREIAQCEARNEPVAADCFGVPAISRTGPYVCEVYCSVMKPMKMPGQSPISTEAAQYHPWTFMSLTPRGSWLVGKGTNGSTQMGS